LNMNPLSRILRPVSLGVLFSAFLVSQAGADTLTLSPDESGSKDAQIVDDPSLSDDNFGNYPDLITNWAGNSRSIGLLEFDISSIAAGATVNNATLSLFHLYNYNLGQTYNIFRVTSAWDESTVTFDTAPTFDPTAVASLTIGDNGMWVYRNWDITNLVQGWVSGSYQNYGMWIEEIPVTGQGSAYFASASSGSEMRPVLDINYTVPDQGSSLLLLGLSLPVLVLLRRKFLRA